MTLLKSTYIFNMTISFTRDKLHDSCSEKQKITIWQRQHRKVTTSTVFILHCASVHEIQTAMSVTKFSVIFVDLLCTRNTFDSRFLC